MKLPNKQRGQVVVLYALLIPIFLFMGGVGLDLGWYYLNVSRLQNAADASVLVGAKALTEQEKINDVNNPVYNYKVKLVDKFPADKPETTISTTIGDAAALAYAKKNLASHNTAYVPSIFSVAQAADTYTLRDSYTRGNPTVIMTPSLYKDGDNYYYVIGLKEDVHHFFLGFLDDMKAGVVAVAKLYSKDQTIIFDANGGQFTDGTPTDSINSPIDWTKYFTPDKGTPIYMEGNTTMKDFRGFWTTVKDYDEDETIPTYRDNSLLTSVFTKDVAKQKNDQILRDFVSGRIHTITFYALWDKAKPRNNKTLWEQMHYLIYKNLYNDYWYAAKAKQGTEPYQNSFIYLEKYKVNDETAYYAERIDFNAVGKWDKTKDLTKATSYYIDFCQSTNSYLKVPSSELNNNLANAKGGHNYGNLRTTHSLFNMDMALEVRTKNGQRIYGDDPLYCRIEAEPYKSEPTPIRQVVININVDNTADNYRPLFFFYDGPDARTVKNDDGNGEKKLTPKEAQPVILNLNADFKGVLWMPDIPVVINGNGHKFEGFIIAKEFRYLDTTRGTQVEYSTKGRKTYSADDPQSNIRIDPATGDVYSIKANGNNALSMYNNNAVGTDRFNLNNSSHFKQFKLEEEVNYMYVAYDFDCKMREDPFHEYGDINKPLIPLYKLDEDGNQVQVTEWADVKLYDSDNFATRKEIKKELPVNAANRESVRLDSDNWRPKPLYDEAGNPVYFSEDYFRLDGAYSVLTLDRVADETRQPHEFLLTKTESDTDDWK